jgi:asparagine synthase (glutamine-hydrolysing)
MYNLLSRLGPGTVLSAEFLDTVDVADPRRQQAETWRRCDAPSLINRMLAYDWKYTLADNDLPKVIGTSALAGVEAAFPFLDEEVVDFSLRLAPELKLKGLRLRWFFKEALRGFLPDQIIAKRKHGFGLPFGVWLTRHEGLRDLVVDALRGLAARSIVRADFLDTLIDRRLPEHPAYYGEMVWILTMLEHWLAAKAPRYAV